MISFWANCFPTVSIDALFARPAPPPPRCPNYVEGQGYRKLDWLHHTKVALYMFYDVLKFINHDCTIPDHEFDVSWSNFLAVWTDSQPFLLPSPQVLPLKSADLKEIPQGFHELHMTTMAISPTPSTLTNSSVGRRTPDGQSRWSDGIRDIRVGFAHQGESKAGKAWSDFFLSHTQRCFFFSGDFLE